MSAIVADTHALIWYLEAPSLLSIRALAALDGATAAGDAIYPSAISLVEITYLVEKGKLPEATRRTLDATINRRDSALTVIPLGARIARTLAQIPHADVPDMPDRIIAATALYLGLPLVTRDARIRSSHIVAIW